MSFKKRTEMRDSVFHELALVTGSSVQTYNEPIVDDYIQRSFDHLFSKRYWDHLCITTFHTLDGVVGVTTDAITGIDDLTDIKWIRQTPFDVDDEICYFSDGLFDSNRYGYTGVAFGETYYDDKRIKFYPPTEALEIAIRARRKPADFTDDDTIPLDSVMLVHLVSASVLAIDGMNPQGQERQQAFFDDRYETLVANEGDNKIVSSRSRFTKEFTVAL